MDERYASVPFYKSWQTVQAMIEKFFLLLPQLVLGIVVFIIFGLIAHRRQVASRAILEAISINTQGIWAWC
jgi:hypothetical protein